MNIQVDFDFNRTALHLALLHNNIPMMTLLLNNGANPTIKGTLFSQTRLLRSHSKDNYGKTPYQLATSIKFKAIRESLRCDCIYFD
jgi:ankyrin repeat protein